MAMGHTSGALRSRNFASSARGLRPDGKKRLDGGLRVVLVKSVLSPELQECMDRNERGAATSTRGRGETAIAQW